MAVTSKYSLPAPADPEMDVKVRETLDYYVTLPARFEPSRPYGLVFCIPGWGDSADSEYQSNKLRPYVADTYNFIVVGVRYHNDIRSTGNFNVNLDSICDWYQLPPDYFKSVADSTQIIDRLFDLMVARKTKSLDTRLAFKTQSIHKYSSFGFMPAIDHLNVLFDVIQKFNIDKSNIIAFGTSYGGYIACLMAKYAPHTFSLVIENSGFSISLLEEVFGGKVGGVGASIPRYIENRRYEIPIIQDTLWSLDEMSPYYFSDAHKAIRNLLLKDHRTPSSTVYCCYHSTRDTLAPIEIKDKMCEVLKEFNLVHYLRVEEKDIDGVLFKTTDHGMDASLSRLFDLSLEKFKAIKSSKRNRTDYDEDVSYGFPCHDRIYYFIYSGKGLKVEIRKC